MSAAIPFDTLAFVRELESAGVPSAQAEAQAKALSSVLQKVEDSRLQEVATKGDVLRLERDIKELEANLKRDIKELELRMVIKLGAMFLAAFGLLRLWPIPVQYVPPAPSAQEMRLPAVPPAPPVVSPSPR
ncbi:MAG: DUF1640 domain-containing protein [Magnetococcales bacterium]|nr:DUF1640 domain-containing protein [Magnetococcales bacterium]MBF0150285.1 DUF1640 domain-containing protein [Magnetococcales bacterium]MBF0632754.1 DUF1640 domain-containing protein [Magnetococcales bacterium]